MNPIDNSYTPGAGTPPPELAGRETILLEAENTIKRTINGKAAKSQIMLGLRGVGKTVLLNRINQIAEEEGCQTAIFEADSDHNLPELLTQQLHRLLLKLDRRMKVGDDIQKAFTLLRGFASAFRVKFGEFELGLSNEIVTGDLSIDLTDIFVLIGKAAKKRNTVAVIFIDEMQYIEKGDLSALIVSLHKISQVQLPLLFFGAGLPQLAKLAGDTKSYAERLFDYPDIDKLDEKSAMRALAKPAKKESVEYSPDAIDKILEETDCYPFFLQVWGSHIWEVAKVSPITLNDAKIATRKAQTALDQGFFKVRFDRLTERQQDYVRAIAEVKHLPATSSEVAGELNISIKKAAPIRDEVIKKGIAYSPSRGLISFTVPGFEDYLLRTFPSKEFRRKLNER